MKRIQRIVSGMAVSGIAAFGMAGVVAGPASANVHGGTYVYTATCFGVVNSTTATVHGNQFIYTPPEGGPATSSTIRQTRQGGVIESPGNGHIDLTKVAHGSYTGAAFNPVGFKLCDVTLVPKRGR